MKTAEYFFYPIIFQSKGFFLLHFFFFIISPSHTQSLSVLWSQKNNPSQSNDRIRAIAVDASGIYIVGWDNRSGDWQWRIEKRDLHTGSLVAGFGTGGILTNNPSAGFDVIRTIAVDGSGIYLAGGDQSTGNEQWRIEKRNLITGALVWEQTSNPTTKIDQLNAIATDASGIYLAGMDYTPDNPQWRIEKRDLHTGTLIPGFGANGVVTSNPSPSVSWESPNAITVDANGIYIAGNDMSVDGGQWRIEKRDLSTGSLISCFGIDGVVSGNPSANGESACGITVNASGIYIAGTDYSPATNCQWRIEKRDLSTGALIASFGREGVIESNPSANDDVPSAIIADASGIYVAGIDNSPGNSQWRIEKRDLSTGALLCTYITNPSRSWDEISAITIDASGIYLAGYDGIPGNEQWRIMKLDLCTDLFPIEVCSFTAQELQGNDASVTLLKWNTATEINTGYYALERSIDGKNFTPICTVNSTGNSSSTHNYQYIDNSLPEKTKADVYYYRIKQTDYDGGYRYSNIEVLNRGSITIIGPSPNPIGEELNFTLVSAIEEKVNISITDVIGQLLKEETHAVNKGFQQIKIPLPGLASGPYLLQVSTSSDGTEKINKQFVVK